MKHYFKIGEISKLYGIGPDSLRYYEELGILTPTRSEKGYRLYSIQDLWQLNVIRDLRKLDFPMEKIKEYLDHRSIRSTEGLLLDELDAIQEKQIMLSTLKEDVELRLQTLHEAQKKMLGLIERKAFPMRHCHMIHSGYAIDEEMDLLIKQLLNKDKNNLYIIGNNRIGSLVSSENAHAGNYRTYDSVFIIDENGPNCIEAGDYLIVSYQGDGTQNPKYIPALLAEAKKQNLLPVGPVLEILWIDIHQAEDPREHITELQIRCKSISPS